MIQPDVKCPECGHEASLHRSAYGCDAALSAGEYVSLICLCLKEPADVKADVKIANFDAERQRIAEWYREKHCRCEQTAPWIDYIQKAEARTIRCEECDDADRIASGYYAEQQQEASR